MSPKDVGVLTPEPVAMLPYMAKGFTDVVKLGSWDRESIRSYLHRTMSSQGSLGEGAWKVRVREGDMVTSRDRPRQPPGVGKSKPRDFPPTASRRTTAASLF